MKVYQRIASIIGWQENLIKGKNDDQISQWFPETHNQLGAIENDYLMHGSGFDAGTCIFPYPESKPDRIVGHTAFHHMDEYGGYDDWSEFDFVVTPTLQSPGYRLRIIEKDIIRKYKARGDVDYFYDELDHCLSQEYEEGGA
jgi:hypothetical protein